MIRFRQPPLLSVVTFLLIIPFSGWANKPLNVLLICVDDLRPELGCYGVDYIQTPNIDRLASESRVFKRHYVQAPTCGASRYALLTGNYGPPDNYALFHRAKRLIEDPENTPPSLPAWFRTHGYTTLSIGKVSHHPGGMGGPDWNDTSQPEMPLAWDRATMPVGPWLHPRGTMHALANGEIRTVSAEMDVYQSVEGTDKTYPDGWITELALSELKQLKSSEKPFLLAVGFIRPHLPFGAPENYLEPYRELSLPPIPHPEIPPETSTWHPSKEFMQYNRWDRDPRSDPQFAIEVRRHYAACVSYIDTQIGSILQQLKALGLDKNTTIVLWGDHGWHLGEHAIWGKHALFEESLHSPLIIQTPQLPSQGVPTEAIVESIDIYPTLCELAGIPSPGHLNGQSLKPHLENPESGGHVAVGYNHGASTIRSDTHRLILHHSGKTELYDHSSTERETENIAESNPQLVAQLLSQLKSRRPEK